MVGEKKHWRLSTPFRRFSGKQQLRPESNVGQFRSRVSSVYLSDDTTTSGFIVVPEFDGSVRTPATYEDSSHATHSSRPPVIYDREPIGFHHSGGSCSIPVPSRDDDLSQRLGSAYKHIRSMPSAAKQAPLSSDPQMLRKQLGVPQHSVFNYPVHSSPDLPNPHAFPHESTSPKLSPTTSPGESHARAPKKFGIWSKTPTPPCPGFSDPFQPAHKQPVEAAPTPAATPPSQPPAFELPCSAHIACMSKPQPSITNLQELPKSRAEKPITSPSSQFPHRQTSRGVLRKPAPDTPLSTSARRWQTSLPQIRSSSPLKVDIPLYHSWHERRTKFDSFPGCYSKRIQFRETRTRRTRGSTEALASLAWTGTTPTISSTYTTNQWCHLANTAYLPNCFSMAIAVEDDSISDDALVNQLETVHRISDPFERGKGVSPPRSSPPTPDEFAKSCDAFLPSPVIAQDMTLDSEDAEVWQAARKTLLCIREIVRTERKYQEALKTLLSAQTATPPPPSMDPYISALVRVSEMLLKRFLEDPSAWGISTAFVTSEDELEAAMVSWCAVAGAFFADENDPRSIGLIGRWRHRKSGVMPSSSPATKQTSTSLSPQSTPVFLNIPSKINKRMDEEYGTWQHPHTKYGRQTTFPSHKPEGTSSQALTDRPPSRKPSVRDLAIQPVQRVMRYVLLYRDLQDCTPPTSPSRLLVEHALEAATRIANQCDSAQRNPAFSRAS